MLNPGAAQRRTGERGHPQARRRASGHRQQPVFAVTHEKSMVVDDEIAFVNSLNWETKNPRRATMPSRRRTAAMSPNCRLLEADWHRKVRCGRPAPDLCNHNGRDRIAGRNRAKHRLFMSERALPGCSHHRAPGAGGAPRGEDPRGAPAAPLKKKAGRGCRRDTYSQRRRRQVHKLSTSKLHAKMLLADEKRAIVGLINLAREARQPARIGRSR